MHGSKGPYYCSHKMSSPEARMETNPKNAKAVELLLEKAYQQRVNDLNKSIQLAQEALSLSRTLQNKSLTGKSLSKLALFYMIRGEHQQSLDMSEEAIACFKELNDEKGIADAKYNIAGIYYKTNNYHLGMVYLIDCLRIYKRFEDRHNESRTQKSLGAVYEMLGDQPNAIRAYEGAIEAGLAGENKNLVSNAYNPLSGILLKTGKSDEALKMIQRSIALKEETGDVRGLAFALYGRGKVFTFLKRYEEAEKDFLNALEIHERVSEHLGTAMAYNKIARLWMAMDKKEEAKTMLEKAIDYSKEHNVSLITYKCNQFLYEIYKGEGNDSRALQYLEDYLQAKDAAINSQTLKIIENYELISRMKAMEREVSVQREKAEMARKQERAEQSAQMKQEFLSAMSHEIRTPLNAVTSIISLLQDRSNEGEQKLLTSLRFSAKNLLRIINDILDFSKLDSNNMKLDQYPVDFSELLFNIKQTYDSMALEKGLSLEVFITPDIGSSYMLDETKLFQILGNLMSNAIKYTEQGAVAMKARLLHSDAVSDAIRFTVEDTGVGIPEKEKARLFESFYMPKPLTTRNNDGTGLGLAIVKKLVELHGSTIQIESEEGKGSKFYFDLKLRKSDTPMKADAKIFEKLENKTAILAEDNEINAMVMHELLKRWGVSCKRVKTGLEAIEIAKEDRVDFILMDIHMPKMNGFDAVGIIREVENPNKNTPIFALTADVTAMNNQRYSEHFTGFLYKPLQIERLFEALVKVYEEGSLVDQDEE
ncbi:MAG: tetratricopeptide repeat protein [Bacteroidota bacterium]